MISSEQVAALMEAQQRRAMMMQPTPIGYHPYQPVPGASQYPPQFAYNARGPGAGVQAGAGVAGAIQSAPTVLMGASAAAGTAAMFGVGGPLVGALTSPFVDPFGHALSRGAAAGWGAWTGGAGAGQALGAGIGAAAPWLLGGAVGFGAMYEGTRQVGMGASDFVGVQGALSRASFANMAAPTMRGYSLRDTRRILDTMRTIDRSDAFTTFEDTQRMLSGFSEMGMMQGVRDAEQLSDKLSRMMKTVRDIARSTGTTIDDALRTFGEMRQAGFFSGRDIAANTVNMMVAGGLGLGQERFVGAQRRGSSRARGFAMSGRVGGSQVTGAATNLLTQISLGNLTDEQIMDIFDAEDAAAASVSFGEQMLSSQSNFLLRSPQGSALLMAAGEMKDGRFTGKIDQEVLDRLARGEIGFRDLAMMAGSRERDRDALTSFLAEKHNIADSVLGRDDSMVAVTQLIRSTVGDLGGGDDMATHLMEQLLGVDQRVADLMMNITKDWSRLSRERRRQVLDEIRAEATRLRIQQSYSLEGLKQGVVGRYGDITQPVRDAGSDIQLVVQEATQAAGDFIMGIERRPDLTRTQVTRGVRAGLRGEAGALSGTGLRDETVLRQMRLQQARRSGVASAETYAPDIAKEKLGSLDDLVRQLRDKGYGEAVDRALDSVDIGAREALLDEIGRAVRESGQFDYGGTETKSATRYVLTQLGGGALAARDEQYFTGRNAFYRAGGSLEDIVSRVSDRYGGGLLFGGSVETDDLVALRDRGSLQDLLSRISESGVAFGGDNGDDLYARTRREYLRRGSSEEAASKAAAARVGELLGSDVSVEDLEVASRLARGMGARDFVGLHGSVAEFTRNRGARAALEAIQVQGFGDLERTSLGAGLNDFAAAALLGGRGDPYAMYEELLRSNVDLGDTEEARASEFRTQREAYRRFGRSSGMVSEQDLARELGYADVRAMEDALGDVLTSRRSGGITAKEAQELVVRSGAENLLGLVAGGGATVSFSGNETTETDELLLSNLEEIDRLLGKTGQVLDTQQKAAREHLTATTMLRDEVSKMKGNPVDLNGSIVTPAPVDDTIPVR